MSASQEENTSPQQIKLEVMSPQDPQHLNNNYPNPSPPPEDDESEAGNIFARSDDEDQDDPVEIPEQNEGESSHVIPKSPDELWKRSVSMRGGRGGGHHPPPAARFAPANKYSPPLSIGMPSWSMEDSALEEFGMHPPPSVEGGSNVITPAIKGLAAGSRQIHPNMFRYPPSSPIKTSPPSRSPPEQHEFPFPGEFEAGDEWIPPPSNTRRPREVDTIKTARVHEPPIHFPSSTRPGVKPQFVRETSRKSTPPRHPSLVVDASTSHDSAETPGRSLHGRVQVVGGESIGAEGPWSLVSQSRSIESGEDSWSAAAHLSEGPTPDRRPGPYRGPTIGQSSSSHSAGPPGYPPRYGMPPPGYQPDRYEREGWTYPPRYDYQRSNNYPYQPPPSSSSYKEEEDHPLLKNYNPHKDSIAIRPQFQNTKKTPKFIDNTEGPSPRKRRRRNPEEKLASAAAMAAAATAAAARAKQKKEKLASGQEEETEDEEDEIKTVGSVEDEDIPAAKRAAMASAVALRAAAGGFSLTHLFMNLPTAPCPPPKAAAEVDFDITDPPLAPVHPPSTIAVLDSASQMSENDVLCGRGGGTNSQMGNRRYRALVRDFQPTYLMARRREKPLMARSVVLVVRKRGGRFLRRDDTDGRLYEVGDEKAEAKTSQALREGLDVRATKTAANTLLGTEGSKKRKRGGSTPTKIVVPPVKKVDDRVPGSKPVVQFERPKKSPPPGKGSSPPVHVPVKPPYYASTDRPNSHGPPPGGPPPPQSYHPYPPHGPPPHGPPHHAPPRYDDPYYRPYPPPYHGNPPPPYGYPYPPPPYPSYGAYTTPPRSADHPPPPGGREPNPFSPPRTAARQQQQQPLTPVHSRKDEQL